MTNPSVTTEQANPPAADTIPVADLLEFIRQHAKAETWCTSAEYMLTTTLGLDFEKPSIGCPCGCQDPTFRRFTLKPGALETVSKAAVEELIRAARKGYRSESQDAIREAAKRWGLNVSPAYKVRVTVVLDAEELEAGGVDWRTNDDGTPADLTEYALQYTAKYAVADLESERVTVEVVR
jgi:hypothetical protein